MQESFEELRKRQYVSDLENDYERLLDRCSHAEREAVRCSGEMERMHGVIERMQGEVDELRRRKEDIRYAVRRVVDDFKDIDVVKNELEEYNKALEERYRLECLVDEAYERAGLKWIASV